MRKVLSEVLGALLVVLLAACGEQASKETPADELADESMQSSLDSVLETFVQAGRLPGVVAGLVSSGGNLYVGAAGRRDLEAGEPMAADSIIAIASMTKPVTTVAVLQLAEQGLVDLDAPIGDYLPELDSLQVLKGFTESGEIMLEDPPSLPTTRQLLTHTSGFVYEIWNEAIHEAVTTGKLPSLFVGPDGFRVPLAFAPGERWEYGIGIDWAGILVESISGKRLDVYFQDHIFGPLGMVDTLYVVPEDSRHRLASTYARTSEGFEYSPPQPPAVSGGGGLHSTVGDYLRLLRALLNDGVLDGAKILEPETVAAMFENQIGGLSVTPGVTQMPTFSNDFDLGFGAPARWGLGFLLHQDATAAGRPAGSASWAGIFNSYFWIDRENDIGAVVATQVLPFYDAEAVALLQAYERAVYQRVGKRDR